MASRQRLCPQGHTLGQYFLSKEGGNWACGQFLYLYNSTVYCNCWHTSYVVYKPQFLPDSLVKLEFIFCSATVQNLSNHHSQPVEISLASVNFN